MDKKKKAELDALTADHESWDSHVATEEHTAFVSDDEDKEIDDSLGLQSISIRLNKSLIEQYKELAKLEGVGYQPLMRQVLTDYAKQNEHKLVALLSAGEASDRAEKLFSQAIQLKEKIPTMPALSNERIFAEGDYHKALTESNALFCNAYEKCKEPVLKQHIKLRLSQIGSIIDEQLQDDHDKKYGTKRKAV